MGLMSNVVYGLANSSGTCYCKWIYENDNLVAILGGVGMIPTISGFALVGPMNKKLGVVKTLRVSFFIGMVACAQSATGFGSKVGNGVGSSVVGWCLASKAAKDQGRTGKA